MKTKKILSLLLTGALSFSMVACQSQETTTKTIQTDTQQDFDDFMEEEFISSLESDYTTYHVLVENPKDYGIDTDSIEVNLGSRFDSDTIEEAYSEENESYKEFKKFDRDTLTSTQQDEYDTYQFIMELNEASSESKYMYYDQLFSSMSGLHYALPTTFADWILRDEQDVKDLITLLEDVKGYVDSALDYTKTQAEKGLLMTDIDSVVEYCQTIVDKGEESSILSSMLESVDALDLKKAESYKEKITEAFTSSFIPAYENIISTMNSLKSQNNEEGYASFENGKEYYEILLQYYTGTSMSASELKTYMEDAFDDHIYNLQKALQNNYSLLEQFYSSDLTTSYTSYDEILSDVQSQMTKDFPKVSDLDYTICDINEEIASDSGVAAYFNIPALDSTTSKQLRVNPNGSDISSVDTYMTVCHEGFPGHMYQYAYMYENVDSNYIKAVANVNGYTEGYATYAQYSSLSYLNDIDSDLLTLYAENEAATYCILVAADIGIHYEGWSVDEFQSYLEEVGFSLDDESAQSQYSQLQANPAAFSSYYVGYEQFLDLKEEAQDALGKKFDLQEFNESLLESGTAPFSVVQEHVDAYINQ